MASQLAIFHRLRKEADSVILAYSGGKDSLVMLDMMQRLGFTVHPYFMYPLPGLQFIERQMQAAEKRFNVKIHRYPHPGFTDEMRGGWYRQPVQDFPRLDFIDIREDMRDQTGAQWIVEGYKKRDSLERRGMIAETVKKWGEAQEGLNFDRKVAWPLADWQDSHVYNYLKDRRIPLPPDYDGNSTGNWGGALIGGWLQWIHDRYPEDFQQIKRYYPHVEAALLRDLSHRSRRG